MNMSQKEKIISLQDLAAEYIILRKNTLTYIEHIASIRNRLTYLTNEKVDSIISSFVDSSRFSLLFSSELYEISEKIQENQEEMKKLMNKMFELSSKYNIDDKTYITNALEKMKQQFTLEIKVKNLICNFDDKTINEDAVMSLVACFKYPPYCKDSDLQRLIDFDTNNI